MDLNELLGAHQEEVMRLGASGGDASSSDHFGRIARYAREIRNLRDIAPTGATIANPLAPQTIIYGSYAGPCDAASAENEGEAANENPDRGRADD
ncbi:hypothetical protein [Qipengyuania sp.]|uniref:hypothetical protein n=1 Tax=Qipengyuania sp. TaxID=2004515 RepID=UPI0035C7B544